MQSPVFRGVSKCLGSPELVFMGPPSDTSWHEFQLVLGLARVLKCQQAKQSLGEKLVQTAGSLPLLSVILFQSLWFTDQESASHNRLSVTPLPCF